jgi:hypothetical protein
MKTSDFKDIQSLIGRKFKCIPTITGKEHIGAGYEIGKIIIADRIVPYQDNVFIIFPKHGAGVYSDTVILLNSLSTDDFYEIQ